MSPIFFRTPFDSGSMEETKANIIHQEYRPLYEPELFSFAGEFFVDGCLRYDISPCFVEYVCKLHVHVVLYKVCARYFRFLNIACITFMSKVKDAVKH